jgi:hypothetical protein
MSRIYVLFFVVGRQTDDDGRRREESVNTKDKQRMRVTSIRGNKRVKKNRRRKKSFSFSNRYNNNVKRTHVQSGLLIKMNKSLNLFVCEYLYIYMHMNVSVLLSFLHFINTLLMHNHE